jgi:hypothetical protein
LKVLVGAGLPAIFAFDLVGAGLPAIFAFDLVGAGLPAIFAFDRLFDLALVASPRKAKDRGRARIPARNKLRAFRAARRCATQALLFTHKIPCSSI